MITRAPRSGAKRLLRTAVTDATYRALRLMDGRAAGVRILTYHRVNEWHPDDLLSVPTAQFRQQMRHLVSSSWQVWPLAQAVGWIAGARGTPAPPARREQAPGRAAIMTGGPGRHETRAVVITFDDGYADNYWNAFPILRELGLPWTLFVASGLMDRYVAMPRYASGVVQRDRGLTWNEIREMQEDGVEIGAHSVTHPDLTAIAVEDARREIEESKRQLERETGHPVQAFAYPKGRHNAAIAHLVREAGFDSACAERIGANRSGEDRFRLRRTEISAFDTLWDFQKKLAGAFDPIHRAGQLVRA